MNLDFLGRLQYNRSIYWRRYIGRKKSSKLRAFFIKTHNPEVAGSSPVSATRKRGQKRFLVKKLRDFKTSEALG